MKILLTDGAGFIGSHTAVELINNGYNPIILDDFRNSNALIIKNIEKIIGKEFNCQSSEIFFTSCATEANNSIIKSVVDRFNINYIITSKLEHHAVLHPIQELERKGAVID